jgi:undecaprenyl-diphosphatase
MTYPQAIILAVVQGITEFLPISSSGHLVILQKYFNFIRPPVLFDVLVHVGTLGAVIYYFRKQLITICRGLFGKKRLEIDIIFKVLIGSIPAAIIGFLLQNYIEQIFDSLRLVGLSLLITAGLLFSTKFIKKNQKDFKYLNWKDSLLIGVFQAMAILPGISRSGSTIVAGLWRNFKRETAFQFSFYLAIPAILGALIMQTPDLIHFPCSYISQGILGMLIAGIVGYFSLGILEKALKTARLYLFGIYCLIVGLLLLIVK